MATSRPALSGKAPRIIDDSERQDFSEGLQRRVCERAYRLFESSGREHGNAIEHWLQAESEVLQHGLEVRESGSWLSINAHVPDVSADDIEIYLEPNRVIVRAEKTQTAQNPDAQEQGFAQQDLFLVQKLNAEIDPSTASAAFKDQRLTLMVKKRFPEAPTSPSNEQVRS